MWTWIFKLQCNFLDCNEDEFFFLLPVFKTAQEKHVLSLQKLRYFTSVFFEYLYSVTPPKNYNKTFLS